MALVQIELSEDITIFRISGSINMDEVQGIIQKHYPSLTRPHIIWDFSHADLDVKNTNLWHQPLKLKEFLGNRQSGKVATVSTSPEVIAFHRAYMIHAEVVGMPFSYNI